MLNHTTARSRVVRIVSILLAAVVATSACDTVFAEDLPAPSEPWLAEPGDWAADFNEAQVACFNGSMSACDGIWLSIPDAIAAMPDGQARADPRAIYWR